MVKNILLKFDEAFFYKMKQHKLKIEKEFNDKGGKYKGKILTWENYIQILLGLK